MSNAKAITLRERVRSVRVLVVHDQNLQLLCDLLKKDLVVREAATVDAAVGRLREMSFACIVCALGAGLSGQDFLAAVSGVVQGDAPYVMFVLPSPQTFEVMIYARREGAWTREPQMSPELESVMRAVDTLAEPLSAVHRALPTP